MRFYYFILLILISSCSSDTQDDSFAQKKLYEVQEERIRNLEKEVTKFKSENDSLKTKISKKLVAKTNEVRHPLESKLKLFRINVDNYSGSIVCEYALSKGGDSYIVTDQMDNLYININNEVQTFKFEKEGRYKRNGVVLILNTKELSYDGEATHYTSGSITIYSKDGTNKVYKLYGKCYDC